MTHRPSRCAAASAREGKKNLGTKVTVPRFFLPSLTGFRADRYHMPLKFPVPAYYWVAARSAARYFILTALMSSDQAAGQAELMTTTNWSCGNMDKV